jgi:hypothetical protein
LQGQVSYLSLCLFRPVRFYTISAVSLAAFLTEGMTMASRTSFESNAPLTPIYVMRLERRLMQHVRDSTSLHSFVSWNNAVAAGSTIEFSTDILLSHCGSSESSVWTVVSRTHTSFWPALESTEASNSNNDGVIDSRCALHEKSQIIRLRRMGK